MGETASPAVRERLAGLPPTFTYAQARTAARLSDRQLSALRAEGLIETIGRGLYQRHDPSGVADEVDTDLLEIAYRAADATLCLTSALARHDLTDAIPASIDIALPRGRYRPATRAPVTWHAFDTATFPIGRDRLRLTDDIGIGIYSPQRCIIDAFRLRHLEGDDLAIEALKRWLRRRDTDPSGLLEMARVFPRAEKAIRQAMVILL